MRKDVEILIADDDAGHVSLIKKNLMRSGVANEMRVFPDGQSVLDFLFRKGDGEKRRDGGSYLILLDIRMPKVDGVEVLRRVKADPELRRIPVIMLTTTDDPREISLCHEIGCSVYIVKPVEYDDFVDAVKRVGLFFSVVQIPEVEKVQA